MAHRELLVTVMSAQDLKNVRLSGRAMSPYAEVWIRNSAATKVKTGVDRRGGINPSWNYVLRLPCEEELFRSGGALTIALRNRGSLCNTLIGTVTVPLSDLSLQCKAADSNASRESTLMSYQVRIHLHSPGNSTKLQEILHLIPWLA
jgi:Ca2+-dependent lipid-binding protein